jgi:hypothetical protein
MAVSVAVAVTPGQAALASGRSVAMSPFAVVLAPLTVGTLADTTSLQARTSRRAGHAHARSGRTHRRVASADAVDRRPLLAINSAGQERRAATRPACGMAARSMMRSTLWGGCS